MIFTCLLDCNLEFCLNTFKAALSFKSLLEWRVKQL